MISKPTLLGHVGAVAGASVSIRQSPTVASGIAIIGGKSYRIGQVGSFVRIPQGYHDLYGIVSEVGASALPEALQRMQDHSDRWMTIQLVGEIVGSSFERGISQHPSIDDEVHLVTEEDLALIYGTSETGQVVVGRLANADGIPVRIDLDKLVTRHSALLGSTGSGKSTTVASLLRSIAQGGATSPQGHFPSARILLLDIHGEYGNALKSIATVFRIAPKSGEQALQVPYWALPTDELLSFLLGKLDDKPLTQIRDKILDYKLRRAQAVAIKGLDLTSLTADTPIPFSLRRLWLELLDPEVKTWSDASKTTPAVVDAGDAQSLRAPRYQPASMGAAAPFINQIGVLGIRRQLDQMRSRLLDKRFDFLMHPGDWEPDLDGIALKDLGEILASWLGQDKPITVLDLSGIPSDVVARLIGAILRIIFDGVVWGREKSEGGVRRPLLVVMEEAHRYLAKEADNPARTMVQRIVKEGRKFGIGAMIVSQRPSEIDETILSQCGTLIALRLSNAADRNKVQASLSDSLSGVMDSLPVLRTGEAIITGEAAKLPIRCRIALPDEAFRPNSEDPAVSKHWKADRIQEDYGRLSSSWRAQDTYWVALRPVRTSLSAEEIQEMEREPVGSTTILSIGYDQASETLEVEFKNGGTYQYYNVPSITHQLLMESDSKGKFLHANIKNAFPYARV